MMRRSWSQIKLIALVMLLTVVAHDVVMAGDPHTASTASHPSHRSHHAIVDSHSGQITKQGDEATAVLGQPGSLRFAHGASSCGLKVAMRPPLSADVLPEPADAGMVQNPTIADPLQIALPGRTGDPDPIPPPQVRRALLQVFLN